MSADNNQEAVIMNSQEMKKEKKKIWIVRSVGVLFTLFLSVGYYLNESQFSWLGTNFLGLICAIIAVLLVTYKWAKKKK
jgi:NhaP-type Na+/H+ or K+/H+ antiporter